MAEQEARRDADVVEVRRIEWNSREFESREHLDKLARFTFDAEGFLVVLLSPYHSELDRVGQGVGKDITPDMLRQIVVDAVSSYLDGLSKYLGTLDPAQAPAARSRYLSDEVLNEALLRKPGLDVAVSRALNA